MVKSCWFHRVSFSLSLVLAAYLRLTNLTNNPGWYTDEGTHLDIAQHYLQGQVQYLAVTQSTLLFGKLPLFELLLAGLLGLTDGGMGTLRIFTGILGVVSVGLLYWVIRRMQPNSPLVALLAAFMYAIYPRAILYHRFGFSYNLLVPLVLLTYLGLWEYLNTDITNTPKRLKWLVLAALAIGLGTVSDIWMFILIGPLVIVVFLRHRQDLRWAIPLIWLPFAVYSAFLIVTVSPQTFIFDAQYIFYQVSRFSWFEQIKSLAMNYNILLSQDYWIVLALIGLFLLGSTRLQLLTLLLFLFPIVILGRTVALYNLSFYYMIPLLPFVGLGMALFVIRGVSYASQIIHTALLSFSKIVYRRYPHPLWIIWELKIITGVTISLVFFLIGGPFLVSVISTTNQVHHQFITDIDPFLLNPTDTRQAVEFVNHRLQPADLTLASPGIAWLLQGNAADFQMSAAVEGRETVHLPANMPSERFAFNPYYENARFIIVDNLWHNWAVWNIAGVPEMMTQLEHWPMVFKSGEIEVYCNPIYKDCYRP